MKNHIFIALLSLFIVFCFTDCKNGKSVKPVIEKAEKLIKDVKKPASYADDVARLLKKMENKPIVKSPVECSLCSGTGILYFVCDECEGTGEDLYGNYCSYCEGRGEYEIECPDCDGTGVQ